MLAKQRDSLTVSLEFEGEILIVTIGGQFNLMALPEACDNQWEIPGTNEKLTLAAIVRKYRTRFRIMTYALSKTACNFMYRLDEVIRKAHPGSRLEIVEASDSARSTLRHTSFDRVFGPRQRVAA